MGSFSNNIQRFAMGIFPFAVAVLVCLNLFQSVTCLPAPVESAPSSGKGEETIGPKCAMQCMLWERKGKVADLKPQDCNCDRVDGVKKKNQRIIPALIIACIFLCPIQELW